MFSLLNHVPATSPVRDLWSSQHYPLQARHGHRSLSLVLRTPSRETPHTGADPLEQAITALLAAQLSRIQSCWKRGAQSPVSPAPTKPSLADLVQSATRHDLVLALYCLSQRPLQSSSTLRECVMDPFDLDWCLPVAVKLAGGGREATLEDRRIGAFREPRRRGVGS